MTKAYLHKPTEIYTALRLGLLEKASIMSGENVISVIHDLSYVYFFKVEWEISLTQRYSYF